VATIPITREWLASGPLAGVDLTFDDGSPFPRAMFDAAIDSAVEQFTNETHIDLLPATVTDERHDTRHGMANEFLPLRLLRRPIVADTPVTVSGWLGSRKLFDFPESWVNLHSPEGGLVRIIPAGETGATAVIVALHALPWVWSWRDTMPDYLRASYAVGFPVGDLGLLHDAARDLTTVYERGELGLSYSTAGEPVGIGHRLATQGDPKIHGAADTTNTLAAHGGAARYLGSGNDAAGLAALCAQLNAIRAAYSAHRVRTAGGVHGAADTLNVVSAPAASTVVSAAALINDLQVVLSDHLSMGTPVHGQADSVRRVAAGPVRDDYVILPPLIRQVIGMMAACSLPLNVAGDLVAGAGIASKSTGIDGLSQSIGTTASAMYSGYSSRISVLKKHVAEMIPLIRAKYLGVMFEA
jgi:hypothetical protein